VLLGIWERGLSRAARWNMFVSPVALLDALGIHRYMNADGSYLRLGQMSSG